MIRNTMILIIIINLIFFMFIWKSNITEKIIEAALSLKKKTSKKTKKGK